ncbi:MAG: peptidylprolyl isomerase [Balneolaceae bacterium]
MKNFTLTALFVILTTGFGFAQGNYTTADQIVALVNDHAILKSDIDQGVADYMRQAQFNQQDISFSEELWYSFLEAEIDNYVLLEKAKIDSITVPDDKVNRQMDARIQQLIQRAGSEKALETAFGKSIIQLKADFREEFRNQLIAELVPQTKLANVNVTRPEVLEFFNSIPTDSLPTIPEQVALSHIVVLPPPKKDAERGAYELAEALRDSIINHGVSIEDIAKRHSTDGTAPNGGLLPMMSLNDLVSEFSAAASALKPGDISKVVKTDFGYHIIRLNKRVGDQIETNHVLIKVDENQLDDQFAIDKLNAIRDSLQSNPNYKFSEFAKRNSEDPSTAQSGGKIVDPQTGERLIALTRLDPSLYRTVLLMDEVGQISEPKAFNPNNANSGKGYRIIRLDRIIPEHIANFDIDYERLKTITLQQKQSKVYESWLQELRNDFYIEYRVPKLEQ